MPLLHVTHVASQSAHDDVFVSSNRCDGQASTQRPSPGVTPSSKSLSLGHSVHDDTEASAHSAQLPSHATQLDAPVLTSMSTKVEAGHSARHSPAAVMNASVSPHVRQSVVAAPLHVSHVASQGSHAILVRFAHMNSGVHEPAHVPGPLENGNAAAHVTHSEAPGPLHVAQLGWHRWHASGCVALPPAHVHPSSIAVQFSPQPSLATRLPSSHTSLPARFPSPQTVAHASGVVSEPPEHDQPGSTVHDAEQPSPATVLLSSQPSEAKGIARRPSPHTGEHVSSPPTPEPPSASEEERHAQPTSTSHSASQPSPPTVLLSSHRSSVVRAPLPQTWITGVKSRVSSSKSSSAATVPLPAASAPARASSPDASASSVASDDPESTSSMMTITPDSSRRWRRPELPPSTNVTLTSVSTFRWAGSPSA